ncbi:MAG: hypothetical protein OHK0022_42890 [Roseiflexaceae bacterium]
MRRLMLCCALTALVLFATVRPASAQIMEPPAQTQIMETEAANSQVMDPSTQVMGPEATNSQVMEPEAADNKNPDSDDDNKGRRGDGSRHWIDPSPVQLMLLKAFWQLFG